jgi:hypothetical protein
MMFELMTTDMRKPLPETIDDLVKWNYTIVVSNNTGERDEFTNNMIMYGRGKNQR